MSATACTVVTGASSGIGEAVARRLIARGENVLAVARRGDRLRALCQGHSNARALACDLSESAAVQTIAAAVTDAFGAVRGFVHCAGFAAPAPLALVDDATAHRLYAVHALFPLRFLGWLAKAPNHVAGTSCVLLSSLACHEGERGNAAYASAKGAVEGMLKAAASECLARGVRVNALALGVVDTPMARETWMKRVTPEELAARRAGYPLGFGEPEKVADIVDFFLGPASSWITGQCLVADGGHLLVSGRQGVLS